MSAPSHTTINVAKRARSRDDRPTAEAQHEHFFRVNIDRDPLFCRDQIRSLRNKYPGPEYEVTVTYWSCIGETIDVDNLMKKVIT